MNRRPVCLVAFLIMLPAVVVFAELAPPKINAQGLLPKAMIADPVQEEWRALSVSPATEDVGAVQSLGTLEKRDRQKADFLSAAKKIKVFRDKYPNRPEARVAKCLEVKDLLSASLATDSDPDAQSLALAADVRGDSQIPSRNRFEVVSLLEMIRMRRTTGDLTSFLSANETSVRKLIAEFPAEAAGYESFFRLAECQPEDWKGNALASELLTMPAPASVKAMAQEFLDRRGLVGMSLSKIADAALGTSNPISAAREKPVIVYSWASWNPGSVAYAKSLKSMVPADAVLIGVNLDKDLIVARALAQAESLPGDQLYDVRGMESPLARALKLTTSIHVFIANGHEEIREASAERGSFPVKLDLATR